MNRLKIVAVAVVAVAAMAMSAWAGLASATVLCSQEEKECAAANIYKASTKLEATLAPKTSVKFKAGFAEIVCTSSTINIQTKSNGGAESRVGGAISAESFTNCGTDKVTVNSEGSVEFEYVPGVVGTGKIFVEPSNSITLESGGVKCTYGETKSLTSKWIMINGSPTAPTYTMTDSETELVKTGGGASCNGTAKMNGTYNLSAPTAFFVVEKEQ
jgi:hypothetical protein